MSRFGPLILLLCSAARAEDARLDALRSSLTSMRGVPADIAVGPRGATPQLTVAKHALRDWMEAGLAALPREGDAAEFERRLNSQLRDAGLFCGETAGQQPCPDETALGFLGKLKFRRSGVFLIAQTGVGIVCGYDESAYVYSWSGEAWRRVWESEQNTYTDKAYEPQTIHSVLISPYSRTNDYLVLTLGSASWCTSIWHTVYYRAFRLGPDLVAPPLVEGVGWTSNDPPIQGSVARNDVLVE